MILYLTVPKNRFSDCFYIFGMIIVFFFSFYSEIYMLWYEDLYCGNKKLQEELRKKNESTIENSIICGCFCLHLLEQKLQDE